MRKPALNYDMLKANPEIRELKISPLGDKIAYVLSNAGRYTIMIMDIETRISKPLIWKPEVKAGFGGSFCWSNDGEFIVYRDKKGHLYRIDINGTNIIQLTADNKFASAPTVSPDNNKILYACEDNKKSYVAVVGSDGKSWSQNIGALEDFIQDCIWCPDGEHIAWMGYNDPNMPWDDSKIAVGDLNGNYRFIDHPSPGEGKRAVTQPKWSPNGNYFTYLSDKSGYMILWMIDKDSSLNGKATDGVCIYNTSHDFTYPSWGSGNVNYVWDADERFIVFTVMEDASSELYRYDLETKQTTKLTNDGGSYSNLNIFGDKLYCLYNNESTPDVIREIDVYSGENKLIASHSLIGLSEVAISRSEHIEWESKDGSRIKGLFYPAQNTGNNDKAPLLVFVHGGPTGLSTKSWNPKIQYFIGRGWNVLEVNYRGSGGYGRDYIQSLNGNWGVYDVEDCKSGAEYLIKEGMVKDGEVGIIGGSAGGYTVLMSLATYPDFYKAGVCLYGVVDLYEISINTHRLEKHYNDNLIGTLPEDGEKYKLRSPLYNAEKINSPLYVFQGDKDPVVPPAQAELLISELEKHNKIYEYELFEGEGHGFSTDRKAIAFKKACDFFNKYIKNHQN